MRGWLLSMTLAAAACGFHPAGDVNGDDATADAAAADGPAGDSPAPVDARVIDAVPIDARPACPAAYSVVSGGARYAYHAVLATITIAAADCDDDLAGRTHLATFEGSDVEAVLTAVAAGPADTVYIGGRCDDALDCDLRASWFWQGSAAAVGAPPAP
jgi:hypothetical protein